MNSVLFLRFVQ